MYLRKTQRKNRDGSTVEYYQLAHNVWDQQRQQATAQVIHSFGRADQLNRDDLVRLCKSIARVCGLEVTDPTEDNRTKRSSDRDVLVKGVKQLLTRPLGSVMAISALWEQLGIGKKLRELQRRDKCKANYERALLLMTANRLCDPTSKLGAWERWHETVHLPECSGLELEQMYKAMDLLHRHATEVEEQNFFHVADLLNLEVDVVFYDTTTCTFSIDYADEGEEGLRRFGRPKDGGWSPQVIVALAVTREGIPVRSWVFPGNTSDVTTVRKVKRDLRGWKLGRALFVGDAGMDSLDNRAELLKGCGRYLLAVRCSSLKEVQDEVLSRAGRYKQVTANLRAKEVVVGQGVKRRRYIVCYNPQQAEREKKHREGLVELLEAELASHPDHDADQKWAIELRASRRFGRYLKVSRGNKLRIDRPAVQQGERLDGKWVLITNDDTLSLEDAATGYKLLLIIEQCFRALKTTRIQMQPVYHWLPRRIEAHVKICVLSLLIQRVAELKTNLPWPRIRERLDMLQATEYHTQTHRFFRRNEIPARTIEVLRNLGIKTPSVVLDVEKLA
jgi:transposase